MRRLIAVALLTGTVFAQSARPGLPNPRICPVDGAVMAPTNCVASSDPTWRPCTWSHEFSQRQPSDPKLPDRTYTIKHTIRDTPAPPPASGTPTFGPIELTYQCTDSDGSSCGGTVVQK